MVFTQQQFPQTPKRGNGCLLSCLGLVALLFLPFILAGAYGSWFLLSGWRREPLLRAVGEMVRQDGTARAVLGDDIQVTGVEGNAFSYVPGIGSRTAYVVRLEGARGNGSVAVTARNSWRRAQIDTMVLTGPDGRQYDLMHDTPLPHQRLPPNEI